MSNNYKERIRKQKLENLSLRQENERLRQVLFTLQSQKASDLPRKLVFWEKTPTIVRKFVYLVKRVYWHLRVEGIDVTLKRIYHYFLFGRGVLNAPKKKQLVRQDNVVDIIIPVYNGIDFLRPCLNSVFQCTDKCHRIIVVDDASPDIKTNEYLEELAQQKEIVLLKNEKNLGFVGSVNRGMRYSTRDVILLNSDTEVSPGWVDKMLACALSCPGVATVTPLTNNGTICSVPNWLEDNSLPPGLSVKEMADLVEKVSEHLYPELPTGVGFCMYVSRDALNKIGYFDEAHFGKGYGEENDFCWRAKKAGFVNLLDDATFIFHKGSMSFGNTPEKQARVDRAMTVLSDLHPDYQPAVAEFVSKNSLSVVVANIKQAIIKRQQKKNLLYVIHSEIETRVGGTECHTFDLISELEKDYNVWLLIRRYNELVLRSYPAKEELLKISINDDLGDMFSHPTINQCFADILQKQQIQLVHFQHLWSLPLSLVKQAKEFGAKVVYSNHDGFFYCPCPSLTDKHNHFCNFEKDINKCNDCLADPREDVFFQKKMYPGYRNVHSNYFKNLFTSYVDVIISPSEFLTKAVTNFCHDINAQNIVTIPHGIAGAVSKKQHRWSSKMNVAFLGVFTRRKGSELFARLVEENKKLVNWFVVGVVGDTKSYLRIAENVKQITYARDELDKVLVENNINLVLLPSIFPETYCYTLSESMRNNIPVIATDLGALPERITESNAGFTFPVDDYIEGCVDLIRKWTPSGSFAELKIKPKLSTIKEMVDQYRKLYNSLI